MKLTHFSRSAALFLTFFLLLTASCNSPKEVKINRTEEIYAVRDAVVSFGLRSKNKDEPEKLSNGSGFFVTEKYIVTAFHVAEQLDKDRDNNQSIEIVIKKAAFTEGYTNYAKFMAPVTLVAKDEENDIAIFSFNPEDIKAQWESFAVKPLPLDANLPRIGDEILLTGYFNKYLHPFTSIGVVSMITDYKYKLEEITFDHAIFSDLTTLSGHSGGPLYSFQTHKVIGLNTRVLNPNNDRTRVSIATNSQHIRKLLESLTDSPTEQK